MRLTNLKDQLQHTATKNREPSPLTAEKQLNKLVEQLEATSRLGHTFYGFQVGPTETPQTRADLLHALYRLFSEAELHVEASILFRGVRRTEKFRKDDPQAFNQKLWGWWSQLFKVDFKIYW